jgi:hypothetical protein
MRKRIHFVSDPLGIAYHKIISFLFTFWWLLSGAEVLQKVIKLFLLRGKKNSFLRIKRISINIQWMFRTECGQAFVKTKQE